MRFLLIILLSVLVFSARPAPALEWKPPEVALQAIVTGLIVVDWGQTRTIAKNPQLFEETNKILGKHPSIARVDNYMAGALAGHLLVSHYLPAVMSRLGASEAFSRSSRRIWQVAWIGVQANVVRKNYRIGLTMSF